MLNIIQNQVKEILQDPTINTCTDIDSMCMREKERQRDIIRAYSLLLYHAKVREHADKSKIMNDLEQQVLSLVEMRPKSLHVTGMFLASNMQGFGTFAMHVCMLCACNIHTTCRDFECFQCMLHVTCIQHY